MSENTDKIKAHLKRNKGRYLFAGGIVAGVAISVFVSKTILATNSIRPLPTAGVKSLYTVRNTPVSIEATEESVEAFNRVLQKVLKSRIRKNNTVTILDSDKADLGKYNFVVLLLDEWYKQHAPNDKFVLDILVPAV